MTSSNQHTPVRVNTSFRLRSRRSAPSANTPARMTSLFLQETAQLMRDLTLNTSRQQVEIAQLSVRPENDSVSPYDLIKKVSTLSILDPSSIIDFIIQIEDIIALNASKEPQLIRALLSKIDSQSTHIWTEFITSRFTWHHIKLKLLAYIAYPDLQILVDKFVRRKQNIDEKFYSFVHSIRKYSKAICPAVPPEETINLIIAHVNFTTFDLIKMLDVPSTFDELEKLALKIEQIQNRVTTMTPINQSPHVRPLMGRSSSINSPNSSTRISGVSCWYCKKSDHILSQCPTRPQNIQSRGSTPGTSGEFCNYCKKGGHRISQCPTRPQNFVIDHNRLVPVPHTPKTFSKN